MFFDTLCVFLFPLFFLISCFWSCNLCEWRLYKWTAQTIGTVPIVSAQFRSVDCMIGLGVWRAQRRLVCSTVANSGSMTSVAPRGDISRRACAAARDRPASVTRASQSTGSGDARWRHRNSTWPRGVAAKLRNAQRRRRLRLSNPERFCRAATMKGF